MIRSIFRFLFKGFFWVSATLGGLIIILAVFAYFKEGRPNVPVVPDNALLNLELSTGVVDYGDGSILQRILHGDRKSLFHITQGLQKAATDKRIKAVHIYLTYPSIGFAQAQEIREAIHSFRQSGKKVYLFADSLGYGQTGNVPYYIASACDEIWIQPLGTVGLTGLQLESPYLKGVFDHLDIEPEFVQRKEYKSFPEMYTQSRPTPADTESKQAIADSFMSQVTHGIAKDRNIPLVQVQDLVKEGPFLGEKAISAKLIDRMAYRDQVKKWIEEDVGKKLKTYSFDDYSETLEYEKAHEKGDKVALIFGNGMILSDGIMADGNDEYINNDKAHSYIMTAIQDKDVKAIVYRINSAGGDPGASQTVAHALLLAREQGKPVIVSMGDMAASGGYWVSCAGTKIVAQPGTLTGSIGVFIGKFSLKGLFEKIGLHWGKVNSGENGGMWSMTEGFSSRDWAILNQYVDNTYQRFINLVSKSRDLPLEKVEKVAKGRVWTGEQAQALGLVDQLGGLEVALRLAREEADLPKDAPIVVIPRPKTLAERVAALISGQHDEGYINFLSRVLTPVVMLVKQVDFLTGLLVGAHSLDTEIVARQKV